MRLPRSWRTEIENGALLVFGAVLHLLLVLCIVAEAWLWTILPEESAALAEGAKAATLGLLVLLFVADALFLLKLIFRIAHKAWRR